MSTLSERVKKAREAQGQGATAQAQPKAATRGRAKESNLTMAPAAIPAVDIGQAKLNTAVVSNRKVLELDPARCRPWRLHNRQAAWKDGPEITSLAVSIKALGQRQYGLVRKLENDPDHDYEIIYGMRRCWACALAGVPFKAEVSRDNDETCFQLMHTENEDARDVSPLEKALSYRDALEAGIYGSEAALVQRLGLSDRHYRKIRRVGALAQDALVSEFVLAYAPAVSFRIADRLLRAVARADMDDGIERCVRAARDRVLTERLDGADALAVLAKCLEREASERPRQAPPQKRDFLTHQGRALITRQDDARGLITIKIDAAAKDSPDYYAALALLMADLNPDLRR